MNLLRLTAWLTLLISLNAHGQLDSLSEVLAGKRSTFTSIGSPKAKGVEISFEYPASWAGEEGKRPNVVYQVTSERGRGRELCNLLTDDVPVPAGQTLTERDISALFDPAGLKDVVPPGARFITAARTTIDGTACGMGSLHAGGEQRRSCRRRWRGFRFRFITTRSCCPSTVLLAEAAMRLMRSWNVITRSICPCFNKLRIAS